MSIWILASFAADSMSNLTAQFVAQNDDELLVYRPVDASSFKSYAVCVCGGVTE